MKILHVPYTYVPDPLGGTEHYVRALARNLQRHQCTSVIAAPAPSSSHGLYDGQEVFRFTTHNHPGASEGVADPNVVGEFHRILDQVRPHIVHLHARTSAVSELLLQAAHAQGARTVVTYHTPTVSCMRGTMLFNGAHSCDGHLDVQRCTSCVLRGHGLDSPLAAALARVPSGLGSALELAGLRRGPWLALRMRQILENHISGVHRFLSQADLVIAPCQWVFNLLLANGVPLKRLRLCRQGLTHPLHPVGTSVRATGLPLRLGCFTRLDPTKGVDVLLRAIRSIPHSSIELSIFGVAQDGSDPWIARLHQLAAGDPRIHFFPALASEHVLTTMAQLDLVVVPSLWMETGPLVVLESFAAGTPVLGSNRGGIAELVVSEVNGQLLPPGDVQAWATSLAKLALDRSPIDYWRNGIQSIRSMSDVACDMYLLYIELLA